VCAARVRDPDYAVDEPDISCRLLGIDVLIDSERTAAIEIARILKTPNATQVDYFANGRVSVIRVRVDEGAPVTRGPLKEIRPERCVIAVVVRGDDLFIPDGVTVIQLDDRMYVVTHTGQFAASRELTGVDDRRPLREVAIVGGGRVGLALAQMLLKNRRRAPEVKIIERNYERCTELAAALDNALVICGDGEKLEVLEEEMVGRSDAFVAVTSDDGTNLLSTLAAKDLGVPEAVVRLSREDYIPLAARAGADAVVVPRLITASTVLKLVRQHPIVSAALLEDGRAQAGELGGAGGGPAGGKALADLRGLDGAVVGAVMRHDKVVVPGGETGIRAGDRLVLFGMTATLPKVQELFRQYEEGNDAAPPLGPPRGQLAGHRRTGHADPRAVTAAGRRGRRLVGLRRVFGPGLGRGRGSALPHARGGIAHPHRGGRGDAGVGCGRRRVRAALRVVRRHAPLGRRVV